MKNVKAYCHNCEYKTSHLVYNKETIGGRIMAGILTVGLSELLGPTVVWECTECGEYNEYFS